MNRKIQILFVPAMKPSLPVAKTFSLVTKMCALACMSAWFASSALADTLVLEPAKDNTLYEDPMGRYSNGAGQYLFIGRTAGDMGIPPSRRRALLSFELSGIPHGSQITSAALRVSINKVPPQAGGGIASLHRMEAGWGDGASNAPGPEGQGTAAEPGDATWVHRFFDTDTWTDTGGDFSATASQTTNLGAEPEVVTFKSNSTLINDVQSWLDQPRINFGWVMLGDEAATKNARRMSSRERSESDERPQLTIEYIPAMAPPVITEPIPTTSWLGLLLLAGLMLTYTAKPGLKRFGGYRPRS